MQRSELLWKERKKGKKKGEGRTTKSDAENETEDDGSCIKFVEALYMDIILLIQVVDWLISRN